MLSEQHHVGISLPESLGIEKACFHSEVDRGIATDLLIRLNERVEIGTISQETYQKAIDGLNLLIPKQNAQGRRVIADVILTPDRERLIRSRLEAKEINIMGADGSWGSLPKEVKQEIARVSNMNVELTRECTNACPFCPISKKGPITEKIRFQDLEELFQYFEQFNKLPGSLLKLDNVFYGTDPFDAKWLIGGEEYDYASVAKRYWRTMKLTKSALFTSTAVPIGEEFRVLRFADLLLSLYTDEKFSFWSANNFMRISLMNYNSVRVGAIRSILEGLYDHSIVSEDEMRNKRGVAITKNRNKDEKLMGKRWGTNRHYIKRGDIYGNCCQDGMVIGTQEVFGEIMQAGSNERPSGSLRIPVRQPSKNGENEAQYRVVHYVFGRHPERVEPTYVFDQVYPDARITSFKYSQEAVRKDEMVFSGDVHRALLRLISYLDYLDVHKQGNEYSQEEKILYRENLQHEIGIVARHMLNLKYRDSNSINESMDVMFRYLVRHDLIGSKIRLCS